MTSGIIALAQVVKYIIGSKIARCAQQRGLITGLEVSALLFALFTFYFEFQTDFKVQSRIGEYFRGSPIFPTILSGWGIWQACFPPYKTCAESVFFRLCHLTAIFVFLYFRCKDEISV